MNNIVRKFARKLLFKHFKSPDELWRKRAKWSAINEALGFQLIASDGSGYNPPLLSNPFRANNAENQWRQSDSLYYEFFEEGQKMWADRAFNFTYDMLKNRIDTDYVVLDVGTASGYQLENFHNKGFKNLWGVDPQTSAVEYGRKHRPYINFVDGFFGDKNADVQCDLLVFFGSIYRIPYKQNIFDAIDRCTSKYVAICQVQEATDDFYRDPHIGLSKRGFVCIEKHVVNDIVAGEEGDHIPYGYPGADGPMIELARRVEGVRQVTQRNFRSYFLFRRVEPRERVKV